MTVTVEEGNDPIDSQSLTIQKNDKGSVLFSGLPVGNFNVVVRTNDYVETRMLTIYERNETVHSVFVIPVGKTATIVDIKTDDTPPAAVEGLNEILTEKEKNEAASGKADVEVKLEVEKKEETSAEGATDMKNLAKQEHSGFTFATILDMLLWKTVKALNNYGEVLTENRLNIGLSNRQVVEIAVPLSNEISNYDLWMYRYHGGVAQKMEKLTERPKTGTYSDGTFFIGEGYAFVYGSGFSTYAIGYDSGNPGGDPEPGGGGGGGGIKPSPSPKPTSNPGPSGGVTPSDTDPTGNPSPLPTATPTPTPVPTTAPALAANIIPIKNGVEGFGSVEIYSLTSKDNTELSGTVFALYNEAGEEVGRGTTIDGYLRFINVGKGTYTYKELSVPEGYRILGKEGKVVITDTKKEAVIYVLHASDEKAEEPEKPQETTSTTIEDILNILTDAERKIIKDLMSQYGISEMDAIRFYMSTRMYGITEDCMKVTDVITSRTTDKDIEGSEFGKLRALSKKSTKKSITLKWSKTSFADGYMVFGGRCNVKGKKFKQKVLATITNPKTLSYKVKKLKKGTYHKFIVIAYKNLGSGMVTTAVSKVVHMATKGGKFTNAKKIKLSSKKNIKLKEKRVKKTKAVIIPFKKKKKLPKHRPLSYESSDKSIATVTWNGRIVGVSKGTCKVYVYAQNGVYKVIKVKVTA